jgi:hypothetical protein
VVVRDDDLEALGESLQRHFFNDLRLGDDAVRGEDNEGGLFEFDHWVLVGGRMDADEVMDELRSEWVWGACRAGARKRAYPDLSFEVLRLEVGDWWQVVRSDRKGSGLKDKEV